MKELETPILTELLRRLAAPFKADPSTAELRPTMGGIGLWFGRQFILAAPTLDGLASALLDKLQPPAPIEAEHEFEEWQRQQMAIARASRREPKPCNCGQIPHKGTCPVYNRDAKRKSREAAQLLAKVEIESRII